MLFIKILLLLILLTVGGVGYLISRLIEELIHENRLMRQDLGIIRMENIRTLAAVRNKARR
jgi:uncharacterized iron-regulated membrane protein